MLVVFNHAGLLALSMDNHFGPSWLVPSKAVEDWKNNGYILLIGFGTAPSMDPMQAGYDRWLSVATESSHDCPNKMAKARSVAHQHPTDWFKSSDPSAQFATEGARVKEDIDPQGELTSRWLLTPSMTIWP